MWTARPINNIAPNEKFLIADVNYTEMQHTVMRRQGMGKDKLDSNVNKKENLKNIHIVVNLGLHRTHRDTSILLIPYVPLKHTIIIARITVEKKARDQK